VDSREERIAAPAATGEAGDPAAEGSVAADSPKTSTLNRQAPLRNRSLLRRREKRMKEQK
jgi:hypothetical protein